MTESRLDELLARLKVLDPETWEDIYQMGFEDCHWPDYLIQGVIQDAIAADDRFLFFEVRYTSYFDVKYEATIFWDGTGSISQDGYGETAAEAILAAYIRSLEVDDQKK